MAQVYYIVVGFKRLAAGQVVPGERLFVVLEPHVRGDDVCSPTVSIGGIAISYYSSYIYLCFFSFLYETLKCCHNYSV